VPVCDTALGAGAPSDVYPCASALSTPFGEAWRRPLGAGLGGVSVWFVPAGSAASLAAESGVLDADDWAAIGRIRDVVARDHARATRIALRLALSHAVSGAVPARHWSFCHNSYGKPEIVPELPLVHFCTAHAEALSAIAVSTHAPVGVDVEPIVDRVDDRLVETFCSARERRRLARLPEAERACAFTKLWTLKEAYAKLTGTGLATDLRSVAFQVETDRQAAGGHTEHRLGDVSLMSWLADSPGGVCRVSVAVDGSDPVEGGGELVCRTTSLPAAGRAAMTGRA
jgi:4'-phosphopantetheinyl transferase